MTKFKDLTGKRFGKLVVTQMTDKRRFNSIIWTCKCDCGNEIAVPTHYLTTGDTQSCGCLKKEQDAKNLREAYDDKRIDGVVTPLFKGKEPRKDSATGYRGVSEYRTRVSKELRYRAWITVKGKRYYKSGFLTAEDAYYNGRLKLEEKYLPRKDRENEKR